MRTVGRCNLNGFICISIFKLQTVLLGYSPGLSEKRFETVLSQKCNLISRHKTEDRRRLSDEPQESALSHLLQLSTYSL